MNKTEMINIALSEYLTPHEPKIIYDAMNYAVMSGGKRIRPLLLLSMCEDVDIEKVMPIACSIELVHNYSLIHDDLPAMDNSDYRRGKLTCHKKFGEAIAILAGDALLTLAFEIMCDGTQNVELVKLLAKAIGLQGMIGGQVMDIYYSDMTNEMLNVIHLKKTAALISCALELGYMLNEKPDANQLSIVSTLGTKLGLAFQIQDDILDYDDSNSEASYVFLHGREKSLTTLQNLKREIISLIDCLKGDYVTLLDLVHSILPMTEDIA